jgi:hypothetical protein
MFDSPIFVDGVMIEKSVNFILENGQKLEFKRIGIS